MSHYWIIEFRKATERDVNAAWSGDKARFRCGFCGDRIREGMSFGGSYTNDMPGCDGNPLICQMCYEAAGSTPQGARGEWLKMCDHIASLKHKYWRFFNTGD